MSNTITPQERALIDAHLAEKGAIHCPTGAMATMPDYVYREGGHGKNPRLMRTDGKNHWRDSDAGFRTGRNRARRLEAAR